MALIITKAHRNERWAEKTAHDSTQSGKGLTVKYQIEPLRLVCYLRV